MEQNQLQRVSRCSAAGLAPPLVVERMARITLSSVSFFTPVKAMQGYLQYPIFTNLEKRILPKRSSSTLRTGTPHLSRVFILSLDELTMALIPSDFPEEITGVLLDVSHTLVTHTDAMWEAEKQAKYVEAVAQNADADPAALQFFLRKHKPLTLRLIKEPHSSLGYGWFTCQSFTHPGK